MVVRRLWLLLSSGRRERARLLNVKRPKQRQSESLTLSKDVNTVGQQQTVSFSKALIIRKSWRPAFRLQASCKPPASLMHAPATGYGHDGGSCIPTIAL